MLIGENTVVLPVLSLSFTEDKLGQVQGKSVTQYLDNEKYCVKYCAKVLTKSLHLTRKSPYQQSKSPYKVLT